MFVSEADCIAPTLPPYTIHYPTGGVASDSLESYLHNDVISYACAEGVGGTVVGPIAATCRDGSWDPESTPECISKKKNIYLFQFVSVWFLPFRHNCTNVNIILIQKSSNHQHYKHNICMKQEFALKHSVYKLCKIMHLRAYLAVLFCHQI